MNAKGKELGWGTRVFRNAYLREPTQGTMFVYVHCGWDIYVLGACR